jgi:2'-5' RNA ligase
MIYFIQPIWVLSMSEMIRAFLSIDIDNDSLLSQIQKVQQKLDLTAAKMKIVKRDDIHFTLRFFGDTSLSRLNEIQTCLDKIEVHPFEAEIGGVGSFPNKRRPRVIWVGIVHNESEVLSLKNKVDSALAEIGYKIERKYTPHATIARVRFVKDPLRLAENLESLANEILGRMNIDRIRMIKSTLTPTGPIYDTLWEIGKES